MRRLLSLVCLIGLLLMSQTTVYANTSVPVNRIDVPLPYILSANPNISGNQVDLSTIAVDRGIFSYVLFKLMNPDEALPPSPTAEQRIKYGYEKYKDERFEPVMKDYTIWAMEAGYLTTAGKANHLLGVKWTDIEMLFATLQIKPAIIEDYSIYDTDNWGFVTELEKETIGMFHAVFGRGIDTRSIERRNFTLTAADMVYLLDTFSEYSNI